MHDREPHSLAVANAVEMGLLTVNQDRTLVRSHRVDAADDAHQRRLAGAVLAADSVDLPGLDFEAHVVQSANAREVFRDVPYLEDVVVTHIPSLSL
jgi:hypothetical protein